MFHNLLMAAVKQAATAELKHLLEKFAENNGPADAEKLRVSIQNSFSLLQQVVDKTKTKLDDTLVSIVLDAVTV